jgi:hypothetical protein
VTDQTDPSQDSGAPETDPAASSSAEDLDEDRLQMDPLEEGMDPPEHWSAADRYGMTPYEQSHPRGLDQRLDEEQPDVQPRYDESHHGHAIRTGRSADESGGSMAETIRTPEQPSQ